MTETEMTFDLPAHLQAGTPSFEYHILDAAGKYHQARGFWPLNFVFHPKRNVTQSIIDIKVPRLLPSIAPLEGNNDTTGIVFDGARHISIMQNPDIDPNTIICQGIQH